MNWLCWHVGTHADPKFKLIARAANSSLGNVLAAWAIALERAAGSKPRGNIGSLNAEELAVCLDCDEGEAGRILVGFTARGLVDGGGNVTKWSERQNGNDTQRKENKKAKGEPEIPEAAPAVPDFPENSGNDRKNPATQQDTTEQTVQEDSKKIVVSTAREVSIAECSRVAGEVERIIDSPSLKFGIGLTANIEMMFKRGYTEPDIIAAAQKAKAQTEVVNSWRYVQKILEAPTNDKRTRKTKSGNAFSSAIQDGTVEDVVRAVRGLEQAA